jgi:hypothetical protein
MVATISPSNSNSEHTLNTLRYAYRVKELKGESSSAHGTQEELVLDDSPLDGVGDLSLNDEGLLLDEEFPLDVDSVGGISDGGEGLEGLPYAAPPTPLASTHTGSRAGINHPESRRPSMPAERQEELRAAAAAAASTIANANATAKLQRKGDTGFHAQSTPIKKAGSTLSMSSGEGPGRRDPQQQHLPSTPGNAGGEGRGLRPLPSGGGGGHGGGIGLQGGRPSFQEAPAAVVGPHHARLPSASSSSAGPASLAQPSPSQPQSRQQHQQPHHHHHHHHHSILSPEDLAELMDTVIRQHRQAIRDNTECGKMESKLLVNLTMRLGKGEQQGQQSGESSGPSSGDGDREVFEAYARDLDGLLDRKMRGLRELKGNLRKVLLREEDARGTMHG